jgi:hypothetical protein
MRARLSPSFVVAVVALVLAAGGTGFAAGKITSFQIQDGTIVSRDVKTGGLLGTDVRDRSLTGADLRDRSVGRTKLDKRCAAGEASVFGGCVRYVGYGRSSYQAAVDDCNRRGGRLPSIGELQWIATHDEYTWADGNSANYEFTSDYTTETPLTPVGMRQDGVLVSNASAQLFYHHCVIF